MHLKIKADCALLFVSLLAGGCIGRPTDVLGIEYYANGSLVLQNAGKRDSLKTNLSSADFQVECKNTAWQISIMWQGNIQSWLSYDGHDYYRMTKMPRPEQISAGTANSKLDPRSLPEFEKILLFVFGLWPDPPSDMEKGLSVPFLGGPDPASAIYIWNVTRSKLTPGIPTSGSFSVSDSLLKSVLTGLSSSGPDHISTMRYISNMYPTDLPHAQYELSASRKTQENELPVRFAFVHPYRKNGVVVERWFRGEITNFGQKVSGSLLPPLEKNTSVQDVRLGKTFLYQATGATWLSAEDAATIGKRLFAAPAAPTGKLERSSGSFTLLIRGVLVLIILAPLIVVLRRWMKRRIRADA